MAGALVGSALPGFGRWTLDPARPAFRCLSVGALAAGVLALVRARRPVEALALSSLAAALASVYPWSGEPLAAVGIGAAGLTLGFGVFLTAALYDALADAGYPVGKFLVTGPLLGGAYVAATAVAGLAGGTASELIPAFWLNSIVGLAIGDGVGFGVEAAELLVQPGPREAPGPGPSAPPG